MTSSEDLSQISEAEAYVIMSRKAKYQTPEEWQEFCALPLFAKQAVAKLHRDAIFEAGGQSAWEELLEFMGTAAAVFGQASGIAEAAKVLGALL